MSEGAVGHYLAEFDRFRQRLPDDRLAQRRARALAFLKDHGFPTRKKETWKYTDVAPITRRRFTLPEAAPPRVDESFIESLRFPGLSGGEMIFVNGHFAPTLSDVAKLPAGAAAQSLRETRGAKPDEEIEHGFTALNAAFLNDGACVEIAAGVEIDKPLHLIYAAEAAHDGAGPLAAHPRNLIKLGRHAKATIIETCAGPEGAEYFTNSHTEIRAEAGARLSYYKIQQESQRAFHVATTRIKQQRDSWVDCHALSLGGALARSDIAVALEEPGAEVKLNGLYLADHRQHLDNHILVEHQQPRTRSDEHYRGVINGHARAVFNGKAVVREQAQKIEAHQSNANLLLSGNAEVDAKPELEIYADDVKCSHGATVGRLDETMLFYLRARGLDKETAKSLLIYAFADAVISDIPLPQIRKRLERQVVGELPDAELIREFMA